jgi:hypothetical protein
LFVAPVVGDELNYLDPMELPHDDVRPAYTDSNAAVSGGCDAGYLTAGGCDQSVCSQCCNECCCPLWTVRAGAVFLRRDNQSDIALTNGATPISVGDLAFNDYHGGPLVTLMRHNFLDTPFTLELTYFGIRDSNTASTTGATAVFSTPTINFAPNSVFEGYRASLDSTEINFRYAWTDWCTVLAGFRCVEMSDALSTNIGGLATYDINVNNHLYGAQLGADVALLRLNRLEIDWFGKAGIYGSSADQTTTIRGVGGAVPNLSAHAGQTAFIGEMDLTGRYQINQHWSLLGGYRVLWFGGVALAPNQIASSNVATGAATLNNNSQPIYHGFTAAAQCEW